MEQKMIDEIRERCDTATRGPWNYNEYKIPCDLNGSQDDYSDKCMHKFEQPYWEWHEGTIDVRQQKQCYMECEHCSQLENMTLEPIVFKENGYGKITILENDAKFIAHSREDIPYLLSEIERLQAELQRYKQLEDEGRLVVLPCNPENPIYHICQCKDIPLQLDGTMYGADGGYGTATGYYCPYEDNCPHDAADCDLYRDIYSIFEDIATGFYVGEDYNGVRLENTPNIYFSDFGKTVFLTREAAEKALKEGAGNE